MPVHGMVAHLKNDLAPFVRSGKRAFVPQTWLGQGEMETEADIILIGQWISSREHLHRKTPMIHDFLGLIWEKFWIYLGQYVGYNGAFLKWGDPHVTMASDTFRWPQMIWGYHHDTNF